MALQLSQHFFFSGWCNRHNKLLCTWYTVYIINNKAYCTVGTSFQVLQQEPHHRVNKHTHIGRVLCCIQVLVQECIRYNKLIEAMQRSLPELQKALKGLVVMSTELEAVGKAIALNAVPEDWEAKVRSLLLVYSTVWISC